MSRKAKLLAGIVAAVAVATGTLQADEGPLASADCLAHPSATCMTIELPPLCYIDPFTGQQVCDEVYVDVPGLRR
jgi:hypothetical protein